MDADFAFPAWAIAPLPLSGLLDLEPTGGAERRLAPRGACALVASVDDHDSETVLEALVVDVSENGLGLLLNVALAPGKDIIVEVRDWDGFVFGRFMARVAHVGEWPEGRWAAGCFVTTPLSS